MLTDRSRPIFGLTIWCLLVLWLFFGGLELAEQLHFVPDTVAEDQEDQDLDEDALSQLASGLKSDVASLGAPDNAAVIIAVADPTVTIAFPTVHQLERLMWHGPPSLPLYQQLSVYRI
ncbi:MAG TPA: hypothetical protein VEI50_12980 [Nitrospiraceae bacterium]|nr:hypothetical protein [Nitrospiraceae bacterium]